MKKLRERYRTSRVFRWAVDLSLLAAVLLGMGWWQTRSHPRGAMPALELKTLDGSSTTFASFAGKPTLVAVWAPWCGVCKGESDNVGRAAKWLGGQANVISVATSFRDVSQVRQYIEQQGVDYPVLLGGDDFSERLGISAYPTLFVLDGEGQIVGSAQGYTTTVGLMARALLAR